MLRDAGGRIETAGGAAAELPCLELEWRVGRPLEARAGPTTLHHDARGLPVRVAGSLSASTESKCTHPLTGPPNRLSFVVRLGRCAERFRREPSTPYAVLFIDRDRSKPIDEGTGDLTGDEFAVVREELRHAEDAKSAAQRVVERLSGPCLIKGGRSSARPALGVAIGESNAASSSCTISPRGRSSPASCSASKRWSGGSIPNEA